MCNLLVIRLFIDPYEPLTRQVIMDNNGIYLSVLVSVTSWQGFAFGYLTNTQNWQYWYYCQLCIPIYLQFPSFLHHIMLVNVVLEVCGCKRIIFAGCKLYWHSKFLTIFGNIRILVLWRVYEKLCGGGGGGVVEVLLAGAGLILHEGQTVPHWW